MSYTAFEITKRRARLAGLTYRDLAKEIGVAPGTIGQYLNGFCTADDSTLARIEGIIDDQEVENVRKACGDFAAMLFRASRAGFTLEKVANILGLRIDVARHRIKTESLTREQTKKLTTVIEQAERIAQRQRDRARQDAASELYKTAILHGCVDLFHLGGSIARKAYREKAKADSEEV